MKRLITLAVVVIVVLGVIYGAVIMGVGQPLIPPKSDEAKEGYTAVFLDNDQVYFGKIATSGKVIVLNDIYYIRLDQSTQTSGDQNAQPKLSLVKLGDQIHGPVDEMRINADHVLFVERLKDDSTVVRAIKQEKDNAANGNNNQAQTTNTDNPQQTQPAQNNTTENSSSTTEQKQ